MSSNLYDDAGNVKQTRQTLQTSEVDQRGEWLSRLMFGWMLPGDLAYHESRSYEQWLTESASPLRALDPANGATGGEAGLNG